MKPIWRGSRDIFCVCVWFIMCSNSRRPLSLRLPYICNLKRLALRRFLARRLDVNLFRNAGKHRGHDRVIFSNRCRRQLRNALSRISASPREALPMPPMLISLCFRLWVFWFVRDRDVQYFFLPSDPTRSVVLILELDRFCMQSR